MFVIVLCLQIAAEAHLVRDAELQQSLARARELAELAASLSDASSLSAAEQANYDMQASTPAGGGVVGSSVRSNLSDPTPTQGSLLRASSLHGTLVGSQTNVSSLLRAHTWRELAHSLKEENLGYIPFLASEEDANTSMSSGELFRRQTMSKTPQTVNLDQQFKP